jgi:dGTPase
MNIRHFLEERERQMLSPFACLSVETRGREQAEMHCTLRTTFQDDCNRILQSKAFRRLKYKTQVFLSPEGDHYRTRLTHTLEVSQIARTVARSLALNEDLTEAIALGHDLGHTPFGHAGERILNELAPGGFHHVRQSRRVVEILENDGVGLNLTAEVLDGIAKHSKGQGALNHVADDCLPFTHEGRVVRFADIIAYVNHDLDDALRAGLITEAQIPDDICVVLGRSCQERIDTMVRDLVEVSTSSGGAVIRLSEPVDAALMGLRDWLTSHVYLVKTVDAEFGKAARILRDLFLHFANDRESLLAHGGRCREEDDDLVSVADFVAGMTDRFAINLYHEIFLPRPWRVG